MGLWRAVNTERPKQQGNQMITPLGVGMPNSEPA